MAKKAKTGSNIRSAIFGELQAVLSKPRTSAYSPQSLVEVCYALMDVVYDDRRHVKYMNREYATGGRAWYLDDGLDFGIATIRLQKMVDKYKDEY